MLDFTIRQQAAQLLEWYVMAGVDFFNQNVSINHLHEKTAPPNLSSEKIIQPQIKAIPSNSPNDAVMQAQMLAAQAQNFEELQKIIANFELCALRKTASTTVYGVGNPKANILILGDVPSSHDDASGKAFSDDAGVLLRKMLASISIQLETDCFATNLLPWRPPANKMASSEEIALCLPLIKRHIELMQPKIIICFGARVANCLIGRNETLNNLRNQPNPFGNAMIYTIQSPSILLTQPAFKRATWQDLLKLKTHA
jgi:uracil-DNA glycosylase